MRPCEELLRGVHKAGNSKGNDSPDVAFSQCWEVSQYLLPCGAFRQTGQDGTYRDARALDHSLAAADAWITDDEIHVERHNAFIPAMW